MKRPRWNGAFEIPQVVNLPGCRVRVQVVPVEEARKLSLCDGQWLYDHDAQSAVVLIDGRLPLEVQRYVLLHELIHAAHDVTDQMLERQGLHVKTKLGWLLENLPDGWCPGPRIAEDA